jgi:DNA-directed RNA polymerase subunit RPC12/RpoP
MLPELRDALHKHIAVDAADCSTHDAPSIRRILRSSNSFLTLKEAHMSYYCSECVVDWPDQADGEQCPTCGGGTVLRQEPAGDEAHASPLELTETAHMAARLCWLWPDDHEQRMAAVQACAAINVDYIEALATVMHDTAASAHVARRELAEALRKAADRLYATQLPSR